MSGATTAESVKPISLSFKRVTARRTRKTSNADGPDERDDTRGCACCLSATGGLVCFEHETILASCASYYGLERQ